MKKLRSSATVTGILGFLSVPALIVLFLALSDIAESGTTYKLEWYVAGTSMIILSVFILSVFVTLRFLLKYLRISNEEA
jgi:hypothetical protein